MCSEPSGEELAVSPRSETGISRSAAPAGLSTALRAIPLRAVRSTGKGDRVNLYLDLDGVILRQADSVAGIELAPHAFEFLKWATEFHRPYWLTTRDPHGQHSGVLRAFRLAMGLAALPADIETLLRSIRPTEWSGNKVFGIDLSSNFVWIDDEPLAVEVAALQDHNLLNRLIVIDTNKDDDGLLRARAAIEELAQAP
jgi:hypothetical protein